MGTCTLHLLASAMHTYQSTLVASFPGCFGLVEKRRVGLVQDYLGSSFIYTVVYMKDKGTGLALGVCNSWSLQVTSVLQVSRHTLSTLTITQITHPT